MGMGERVMNWFGAAAARGMDPDKPDGNAILCVAPDVQSRRMDGPARGPPRLSPRVSAACYKPRTS